MISINQGIIFVLSVDFNNYCVRFYQMTHEFLDIPTEVLKESMKNTEMAEKRAEKNERVKRLL